MKRVGRELGLVALFLALTVAMTWPLVTNMTTALPHPEDPAIVTWILDWDFHALLRAPLQVFDANIFHPHRDTLAFSENLLGIAVPLLPAHLAGASPVTVYNIATLLGFALTGYGAFVLARLVTASAGAALCSGIWFAFFSFRFTHLTHLQHLWAMWLPLLLAASMWFAQKPTRGRAALFGVAFLMNGLTNLHWFAFGSVAIALSVLVMGRRDRRYWLGAFGAMGVASLLLVPVLLPYQRVRSQFGFRGDATETLQFSATVKDWLVAPVQSRWYARYLFDPEVNPERWLFPGGLVLVLACVGAITGLMGRRSALPVQPAGTPAFRGDVRSDERRSASGSMPAAGGLQARPPMARATSVALLWALLGFVGSLGLNTFFGRLLFEYVPLFKGIRVPARWAFIAYTGLALLAAIGIARISRRAWVHALIAALFVIECWVAPIRWFLVTPDPPVYRHLQSERGSGAVLELPLAQEHQYEVMLRATAHHRPLVNGVSGFEPPEFAELRAMSEASAIPSQFLERLERIGVTTIVVHADRLGATADATRAWITEALRSRRLTFAGRFDAALEGDYVFVTRRHPEFARELPPFLQVSLQRFLAGLPTQNDDTFGLLEWPKRGANVRGQLHVFGFAVSPYGIREVHLRFANGRKVVPADLVPRPEIAERFPWYPMTDRAGFVKDLDVPLGDELQVEIVDGRGRHTRLQDVWFTWVP